MNRIVCLIFVVLCCAGGGCNALSHSRDMKHSMSSSISPTPEDRADTYEDENRVNREHEDMMLNARKNLPASKEADGRWNMISSAEARSIERSLGVQYQ